MIGTNGWHETTVTQTVHYTPKNCSLDQSTETVTMLMQGKIKQKNILLLVVDEAIRF